MRVGLIARADDRGLGVMTHAFYRHLQPERTLVIDMGSIARGFSQHFDRYPGERIVTFDGHHLPEPAVREWLRGLDVVYSAETFYDWRVVTWAAQAGVATVCHAMPEFWKHPHQPELPHPDAVWAPTTWRLDLLPESSPVVPVPVEDDRWSFIPAGTGDRLQVLHTAGHRAAGDRNGTLQLLVAAQRVHQPMDIWVHCQDERLPQVRNLRPGVSLHLIPGGRGERQPLYAGMHLQVLPRRYGGLCLVAQEALGAGLGLAMSACPPNQETWPLAPLRGQWEGRQPTPSGEVRSFTADATYLSRVLDQMARTPSVVDDLQLRGVQWAKANSWAELAPLYRERLAEVVR